MKKENPYAWNDTIQQMNADKKPERKKVATPMLDYMLEIKDESQRLGQFLEWLRQKYSVRKPEFELEFVPNNLPSNIVIEDVLAEYFQVDLQQADAEKWQILNSLREEDDG